MRWQIEPLVGLGPLKFGMTRAEVGAILDPIHSVDDFSDDYLGGKREFRGLYVPVISYTGADVNRITATGFEVGWRVKEVYLDEFDIFEHPSKDVLQFLEHKSGAALAGLGFVLFDPLGINTSGFFDEKQGSFFDVRGGEQDERNLALFPKGAFDSLLGQFHKINFENL